ncbi:MAG: outer membrane protein [Cyanobium sp.]
MLKRFSSHSKSQRRTFTGHRALVLGATSLASLTLLLSAQARAEDLGNSKGFYGTLGLGASWLSDQTTDFFSPASGHYEYNGGFAGDVGLGYDFGALRAEITYAYNRFTADSLSSSVGTFDNDGGIGNLNSGYASLYWDLPVGGRLVPYLGGGIGYTNYGFGSGSQGGESYRGSNVGTFAYQGKVGVSYTVSHQADVFLEGVYQGGSSFSIGSESYGPLNSWGGRLGVRWRFGGPVAPPVAVEPAPAPLPEPASAPMPEPEPAPAPVRGLW